MKRTALTFIALVLLIPGGTCQMAWEKIYGGKGDQFGYGVAIAPGGYAVAGHTALPGSLITDAWILFLDEAGDTLWSRTFGASGIDDTRSVIVTGDSAMVACGTYSHEAPFKTDFYLLKLDLNGDTIWTRTRFSTLNSYGYSVSTAPNGFILCGYADVGKSTPRMMMVRTNSSGDTLWTRLYGDTLETAGFSAIQTNDGGFIACGYIDTYNPDWERNTFVVKTIGNGDTIWTRNYPNTGYDVAWCIGETADHGFILTGYRNYMGSIGTNLSIMRIDPYGALMWEKNYGLSGLDIGYSGMQTMDGGYIFCGQSNEQGSEFHGLYLVRTDSQGDSLWTRQIGDYPTNAGSCVRETADGGFIIAGGSNSQSADGLYDVYIVRTHSDGTITSSHSTDTNPGTFSVYPNPSEGTFAIDANDPVINIEIIDIRGNCITPESVSFICPTVIRISLPPSCKGPFLVRTTTLQGVTVSKLFVL
jgi:hypothetical protein